MTIGSTPPDKPTVLFVITQDCIQAIDIGSAIATVETPTTTTDSYCCSCHVLEDIRDICYREEMPLVHFPSSIER